LPVHRLSTKMASTDSAMVDPEKRARRNTLREDALNLPNLLTMGRVVVIPIVLWLMAQNTREGNFWATILYSLAAITDFLVMMVELGHAPAWAVIIITARELSITALRTIAISEGVVMEASRGGKDKTAVQMVALVALILHDTYILDWGFYSAAVDLNSVGLFMLYLSVFFAITSAGEYISLFVAAVEAKEKREKDAESR